MRTCRKCGEIKPLSEFDIRADTGRHRTECKACRRVRQRLPVDVSRRRSLRIVGTSELLLCRKCGEMKPATEFPRRGRESHLLHAWCRACFSAYKAERHQKNHAREMERIRRNHDRRIAKHRALIAAYLSTHPCVDCGEADVIVLDFDHVRGIKFADVSWMVASGYPWAKIEEEIAKCDVRCANDHRRATAKRRMERRVSEPDWVYSEPGGARSLGLHIRSVPLYPTELRAR